MAITANGMIAAPDEDVVKGLSPVVFGMLSERHALIELDEFGSWNYDAYTDAARTLEARIAVHTKALKVWKNDSGRDGLHVVCLDGKPIAVVREHGYTNCFLYEVAALDLAALDGLVQAVLALRGEFKTMDQTDPDVDIAKLLELDPEPVAAPFPRRRAP